MGSKVRQRGGVTLNSLLRLFVVAAAGGTLFLLATSLGARDTASDPAPAGAAPPPRGDAPVALRGAEKKAKKDKPQKDCAEPPCVPSFWAPTDISGVEHGDPRVTLCKLKFDGYWRQPSKTPMFRDLQTASKCGKGKSGRLGELYDDLKKKGVTPLEPAGFVFHESRVGSTLVANMLASVPTNLVYSESSPPPVVLNHCRSCGKQRQRDPVWKPNLQPDFNVSVSECFDTSSSAGLRELDESDRSVQKSAESTSI